MSEFISTLVLCMYYVGWALSRLWLYSRYNIMMFTYTHTNPVLHIHIYSSSSNLFFIVLTTQPPAGLLQFNGKMCFSHGFLYLPTSGEQVERICPYFWLERAVNATAQHYSICLWRENFRVRRTSFSRCGLAIPDMSLTVVLKHWVDLQKWVMGDVIRVTRLNGNIKSNWNK